MNKFPELYAGELVPQGFFLESMGISARVEVLAKKNPQKKEKIEKDYQRLASPEQMGEIYKCFYAGNKTVGEVFPFTEEISYEKNN